MCKIQRFVLALLCLGLLADTCLAAQGDLSELFVFQDECEVGPFGRSSAEISLWKFKPWAEKEKEGFLELIRDIRQKWPGLMQRATAYRPIRMYRAERLVAEYDLARADVNLHALSMSDLFFQLLRMRGGLELKASARLTLIHELVHLADSSIKIAWSKEWLDLVKPRMDRVQDTLKKRGKTARQAYIEGGHDELAVREGFPNVYAAMEPAEALAECTAHLLAGGDYAAPQGIETFIQSKLLSTPFVPDPAVRHFHQGIAAFEEGRTDDAILAWNEAIRLYPDFQAVYALRANAWVEKNELDRAIADYSQTIRVIENAGIAFDGTVYFGRGKLWSEKGESEKAIADYGEYIARSPHRERGYRYRGFEWSKRKEYDKAIADYNEATKLNPNFVKNYYGRALAWREKNENDKAIADFGEAIRCDPRLAPAYKERGCLWLSKKEYDKAIADFTELIRLEPDEPEHYSKRAGARQRNREYDKAIADYGEVIKRDPSAWQAFNNRGDILDSFKKEYDKAIADFSEVIKLDPAFARAWMSRGMAWADKGNYDKAIADYGQYIDLKPSERNGYALRAELWLNMQQFDKAIADYSQLIRLQPKDAQAYFMRGVAWANKGEADKALADFSETVKINPKHLQAYGGRAELCLAREEFDQVFPDADKIIELAPNNTFKAAGYFARGQAWHGKKESDKAIQDYSTAIKLYPNFVEAYFWRGRAWNEKKKFDKAIADYRTALRLNPGAKEHIDPWLIAAEESKKLVKP